MIRNDRQYRVTQRERDRLVASLGETAPEATPEWVVRASRSAVNSQVLELEAEIDEYEALRAGTFGVLRRVEELAELPRTLVRARIAAHLTQRELAERLDMREQQIQRYEANDYAGANLARLEEVMVALGVTFRGDVTLPSGERNGSALRRNLLDLGLSRPTVSRRFFGAEAGIAPGSGWMNAAARAARIFQTDIEEVVAGRIPTLANAGAFRASKAANRTSVNGYARYAEYLGGLLARACAVDFEGLPDLADLRDELSPMLTTDPLPTLVRWSWEHGMPVLPLSDVGTFYGACWHLDGRPVIALKHGFRSPDRWSFLLAHEIKHAADPTEEPVLEEELDAREWRDLPSEREADEFASNLLLGETAEAMLLVAIDRAGGNVAKLKAALPAVAAAGGVTVGLLADYAANRLTAQSVNWWPSATSLHADQQDAWSVCRSILFDYVDLSRLDSLDREILIDGIGL